MNKEQFSKLTNAEKAKAIQQILKGEIEWESV